MTPDLCRFKCWHCGATLAKLNLRAESVVQIRCWRCHSMNQLEAENSAITRLQGSVPERVEVDSTSHHT
jgi:phage FluMu protein Com